MKFPENGNAFLLVKKGLFLKHQNSAVQSNVFFGNLTKSKGTKIQYSKYISLMFFENAFLSITWKFH